MEYRKLGKSNLKISLLGYGAWALSKKGWGDVDPKEAARTVEQAVEHGINFFDTAPVYGFGKSEQLLGELLSPVRNKVLIATKCGLRWNDRGRIFHDLSRDSLLREIDTSLERLKTDYIDLYQIHWPDKKTALSETLDTLTELKNSGTVRHIGVSNFNLTLLEQAAGLADITALQSRYNLLQRDAETELLPYCRQNNIGFVCYSPLAQGILSGKIKPDFKPGRQDVRRLNPLFRNREVFCRSMAFVKRLPQPPALSALKFLSKTDGVTSILVSMTRIKHLLENLRITGCP